MIETENVQSRVELARVEQQRRNAWRKRGRSEFAISMQADSPVGFSRPEVNKQLALSYIRSRAREMLLDFTVRRVSPDDLHLFQPLHALRGTGFVLPPQVKRWVRGVVDYSEDIFAPQSSWIALKTERRGEEYRCGVVEAMERGVDDWVRFRRFGRRMPPQGRNTALPFLLYEEALRKPHMEDNLARLAKALTRGG